MTVSDMIYIVGTVAVTQLVSDLVANQYVFNTEAYKDLVERMERAKFNLNREEQKVMKAASGGEGKNKQAKQQKRLDMMKSTFGEATAAVAQKHVRPNLFTSIAFVILYRILVTSYYGKVLGAIPFRPWSFIQRVSRRGLLDNADLMREMSSVGSKLDASQACAFLFVYVLSTLSVKYFIHQAVAIQPPKGADRGVFTLLDHPVHQKRLKAFGIDPEDLKFE